MTKLYMKQNTRGQISWLFWAIAFLVIAIIAGILGMGLIAGVTYTIARWLAIIFVILFIVAVITHFTGKNTTTTRRNNYK